MLAASGHSPAPEFLADIHRRLAAVYEHALNLPSSGGRHPPEAPATRPAPATTEASGNAPRFHAFVQRLGADRYYFEVFDPWEDTGDPAVVGDLADDLWDIYTELQAGLALWDQGRRENAIWEWRFGFEMHWGEHATGAMRALYMLARRRADLWGSPP